MTPDEDRFADRELEVLGARLRTEAAPRTGDLADLAQRSRAATQRSRAALVGVLGALVVAVVVFGLSRSGSGTDSLDVGGIGSGGAATSSPDVVPAWTVNPSIPIDEGSGEVWAVDIVFDPAVTGFEQFSSDLALIGRDLPDAYPAGMASFHAEPRLQAYWVGDRAQQAAERARDQLTGRPGIVSIEVGPAVATSRPPGTSPPSPPATSDPLARPVLPDPRPTQEQALADGTVTDDEYVLAFWTFVECAEADGAAFSNLTRAPDGRFGYSMSTGAAADACYTSTFLQVDMTWQLAHDSSGPTTTTRR